MKKISAFKRTSALLLCVLILNGCGTVRLEVPDNHEVRLLEKEEYASIRSERPIWFWLWGGRPISDNTTRTEIEKFHLQEIRLQTEQNLLDSIVNVLLIWSSIVRRTLIVEGNPGSYLAQPAMETAEKQQ